MDLFSQARKKQIEREAPLAYRLRPRTLDEFEGQGHIVGPGRLLRRSIQADQLSSLIFYGPPGTGKTTLAAIIANTTDSHFITINAVLAGKAEIRSAIEEALTRRNFHNKRTTLFVDEVHRWNKAQQDALLPHVENGAIIFVGATTENPYFEVNKALVSRSRIFQLKPLEHEDLKRVALRALQDSERGYGQLDVAIEESALDHLADVANGDARAMLNALELAVETTDHGPDGKIAITLSVAEESIQKRAVLYDKDGDAHYDTISAFIKSLRGSDPDAALYWMSKMVYAGEDPRFIFRRMAILAGEDVGLADPSAIAVVMSCWQAYERIGMPEARFHLAEAALYLATCPKSNTTLSFFDALKAVESEKEQEIPDHLKDSSRDKKGFGHGKGYLYPHSFRDHWVAQQYLPESLQGRLFYRPGDQGYEREVAERVSRQREIQIAAALESDLERDPEILTSGPNDSRKDVWLRRATGSQNRTLMQIRDRLFEMARLARHHLCLVLEGEGGLLTWEAVRRVPEGGVWTHLSTAEAAKSLGELAAELNEMERPQIVVGNLDDLSAVELAFDSLPRFEAVLGRNVFTRLRNRPDLAAQLREMVSTDGSICLAEVIPSKGQRLNQLLEWPDEDHELHQRVIAAEERIFADADDSLVNWGQHDLETMFQKAGFDNVTVAANVVVEERRIGAQMLERWFAYSESKSMRSSYGGRLAEFGFSAADLMRVEQIYRDRLAGRRVQWEIQIAYVKASNGG